MKKENKIMAVTMGIVCFVLLFVLFVQFRTVEETDISGIEEMQETELKEALSEWKTKYEEVNAKLEDTNSKIAEYKEKKESNVEATELIESELQTANMILGKTDVQGEGIEITITDGYKTDAEGNQTQEDVDANDLLELVNELKKAGAEAISINEQRVVNMTDIVNIGTKSVLVNSQVVSSPYTIKAIGDRAYLESALSIKNGYVDQMKADGKSVTIENKRNVVIPKYEAKTDEDKMSLKYITVEE